MWRNHPIISAWAAAWIIAGPLFAADQRGQVLFNSLPVPGATITAIRNEEKLVTTTDVEGRYSFPNLAIGPWSIKVAMFGFVPLQSDLEFTSGTPATLWQMKLLPLDQIHAQIMAAPASSANRAKPNQTEAVSPPQGDLNDRAADGFLINGSMNNGAASPFSQAAAFGNTRGGGKGLYNGGIGLTFDNSALDARPFSLTGQDTPKASYNRTTGSIILGGPLRIPHLIRDGPNLFIGYQWTRNRDAVSQSALVPNATQRSGDQIPASRISPQALALLAFYPLPNFSSSAGYNYQIPLLSSTHQDALQSRFNKNLNTRDQLDGRLALQSTRSDTPSVFGFLDTTDTFGVNTAINWTHRLNHRLFFNAGYQYSYFSTKTKPYFAKRENVSGMAGISGSDQSPGNWGPPALLFSSGITELNDAQSAFNRNQTSAISGSLSWNRGNHNFQFGGAFRRQQFNYLEQQNPRGVFTFTGAATGSDFADFLLGSPAAASIAYGNADKYFRESVYETYVNDDWRIKPELTLNVGLRWEYGAPITELYGRLVNLDIASDFAAVAPIIANHSVGPLTGQHYPSSLIQSDKRGLEPRIGLAWRPLTNSSWVMRAGYGLYHDTSVYQTIANQMAQQAPLSKNLSVQNSPSNPLTLANGFNSAIASAPDTFAVDPNFRLGYAQNWQLSIQRDLPASLRMTANYLGIKGTRGVQELLPNTFPAGSANACGTCPFGFAYLTSNGNSTRQSAQLQLRRRLHSGITGMLQYTFSKSIDDDAALGGSYAPVTPPNNTASSAAAATTQPSLSIAQNWRDLSAERSLSSFDQRHLLALQLQYTTGMGVGGGTLLSGWKGTLLKEWTFATLINAGSGLPQTAIYLAPITGTAFTGTIRPDYTGQPLYARAAGVYLNPAAYSAPPPGEWGNAGRDTITGPGQFTLNASLGRTFRVSDRLHLDLRFDSTNALNHVTFTAWNTTINSPQFGFAAAANAMRSMQTTLRLRF